MIKRRSNPAIRRMCEQWRLERVERAAITAVFCQLRKRMQRLDMWGERTMLTTFEKMIRDRLKELNR